MPKTHKSTTDDATLNEVTNRLSRHPAVDGLIVVGSASRGELNPASDYDLVVILSTMAVPLRVGVTSIDGRRADVVFCRTARVEEFLAAVEPLDFGSWTGRLVGWLREGNVVFDRDGRVKQAQEKASGGDWLLPTGTASGLSAWIGVNYNLQVARRYLTSDDPLYLATADVRIMLYGPSDLFFNYFEARRLRWSGEKAAIQYLQQHDPAYLSLFNQFLSEPDRQAKFKLYEELAALTVAPVGELWAEDDAIMMVDAEAVTPEMEEGALDFWESLLQG